MATAVSSPGNDPTGYVYVDSLIWGNSWDVSSSDGVITYSFDNGTLGERKFPGYLKDAIRKAFALIETFIPVEFQQRSFLTEDRKINQVDLTYGLESQRSLGGLGFHQIPGDEPFFKQFGSNALSGAFAYNSSFFSKDAVKKGGQGFAIIVHEILHGLGLAHPHDRGGGSSIFPGVSSSVNDFGTDGQNQAIFTIMSYNAGYASKLPVKSLKYGDVAGPMALDIAALQAIYGAAENNIGNSTYKLPDKNGKGTKWQSIWDTGGNDTITADGHNKKVRINLNDADLEGSNAGGSPSFVAGIRGGFTIANGVVIENAIGGKGNDRIYGNEADNILNGKRGNDTVQGQGGDDRLFGHKGKDTLNGGTGNDTILGGKNSDTIIFTGNDGNDVVHGGSGSDWLKIVGTLQATIDLSHNSAQNTGYGTDTIISIENVFGSSANDKINGSSAENKLIGGSGNDVLNGGAGKDILDGGIGDDQLLGSSGKDILKGGLDDDTLIGGFGNDIMSGGAGSDVFVFLAVGESKAKSSKSDVIKDFTRGEDQIDLSAIDASTVLETDDVFTFNGKTRAGSSEEGEIYFVKKNKPGSSNDHTLVYVDTDAEKDPEMIIYLKGLHNLTADDFIL